MKQVSLITLPNGEQVVLNLKAIMDACDGKSPDESSNLIFHVNKGWL